jgi:hypothetical protein
MSMVSLHSQERCTASQNQTCSSCRLTRRESTPETADSSTKIFSGSHLKMAAHRRATPRVLGCPFLACSSNDSNWERKPFTRFSIRGVRKHFVVLDTDQPKRATRAYLEWSRWKSLCCIESPKQ